MNKDGNIYFKPARTLLFVPGNKESWIEKVVGYSSDAVILDLEDSVPPNMKEAARDTVASKIPVLAAAGVRVFVRINKGDEGYDTRDISACAVYGLEGLVLPKPEGPEDIQHVSQILNSLESPNGSSKISLIPTLETARSIYFAYECSLPERVVAVFGAVAKDADGSRSVGYQWTADGAETLHLRSHVVLAARAAGKVPLGGLWQQVGNLDGLRASAQINRNLGMSGEMIIHPSHADVVNQVYSPSPQELSYYRGVVAAYEKALTLGRASVVYEGDHIDLAHVQTARALLEMDASSQKEARK